MLMEEILENDFWVHNILVVPKHLWMQHCCRQPSSLLMLSKCQCLILILLSSLKFNHNVVLEIKVYM